MSEIYTENVSIFVKYNDMYDDNATLENIIEGNVNELTLQIISFLSFGQGQAAFFREWFIMNSKLNESSYNKLYGTKAFSRLVMLTTWEKIFSHFSKKRYKIYTKEYCIYMMNMFIHKMLARICDYHDERCENIYSEFIKILFNSERDKYIAKMYRAIKIFIEDHDIDKYNNLFLYKYNVDVKEYINVVYFIIKEFTSMQDRIGSGECNIYEWGISSQDILNKLNIDIDKIDSILRMISLSYDEWILFLANNPSQKERFYFFRDKPLFAIDKNIYIPIDGRFLEELLFDTLRRMYEKLETKSNFSRTFGKSFERYILSLINEFCFYSKQHTYMGEFEYGPEPLRKKSPDGFIISEDGIVVIEVKSSKVFDEVIIGDGNCNCLYKNIYSLFDAPYEQMIHSIKDIEKSCHELIKKEIEKIYIIVTFSNMPLMLIENNDTNKQYISNEKNSFSVMAFEMLLAASEVSGSTCFHILKEYREYPHKITAKNFFTRKFVENDGDYNGKIFQNMSEYSEKFHQDYRRNNSNS